ncbi:MAG: 30S ribosomal protein S2 [Patescibacteria group bacterium]
MRTVTLEELLEAGCHFGHQVTRSNPKAREFIYEARDNIHIIDLAKTKQGLEDAGAFIKDLASRNGTLVVVGTKRQGRGIVQEVLRGAQDKKAGEGLYYVTNRWVGGLLTNFQEVSKNFRKYHDFITDLQDDELKSRYTKKEIGLWDKERQKLENLYGGVANITKKPDALFIIDSHLEDLAVREARTMHVTTVAIVDTNADPSLIDYPIPANDDAVGSIKLIVNYIIDAWIEGRKEGESRVKKEMNSVMKMAKKLEKEKKTKPAKEAKKDDKSAGSKETA